MGKSQWIKVSFSSDVGTLVLTKKQTNLVIKIVSGKCDDTGSGIKRERVHAPVRDEGVRHRARAGGRSAVDNVKILQEY